MSDLTEDQQAVLHFEREWWSKLGSKEASIRGRFALTPTAYYVRLNRLLDDPAALEADPLVVNRLRRRREQAQARRRTLRA